MNNVQLIGRLCAAPELKKTPNGTSVVTVALAVNRRKRDDGADFVPLVLWSGTAETVAKYCHKGDQIGVTGRLQVRQYEKDGQKRTIAEVVVDNFDFLAQKKTEEKPVKYEEQTEPDPGLPF